MVEYVLEKWTLVIHEHDVHVQNRPARLAAVQESGVVRPAMHAESTNKCVTI